MHALIAGSTVSQYPYSLIQLRKDNPNTSFPRAPDAALLEDWGVYPVTPTAVPPYDPATQRLEEGDPTLVSGEWTQQWAVVDLTAQEIADRLAQWRASASVPRLAARLALLEGGLWDSIPALIDGITDATQKAQTLAFFEDARNWRRDDATVQALAAGLGLSDTELDDLFEAAAVIEAGL